MDGQKKRCALPSLPMMILRAMLGLVVVGAMRAQAGEAVAVGLQSFSSDDVRGPWNAVRPVSRGSAICLELLT
jgi:hypothetical protein